MRAKDYTGKKFGRLTAICPVGNNKRGQRIWLCRCDCGNEVELLANSFVSGNTLSCGCLRKELLIAHNRQIQKHGYSHTRLYSLWSAMKERCKNDKNYAGRGIQVCREWHNFMAFRSWALSNGYKDDLSIDRINVNGNYEPSNCRWIEMPQQARNRRNNHKVLYRGENLTLAEWSERTGIESSLIRYRLAHHWDLNKVFTK